LTGDKLRLAEVDRDLEMIEATKYQILNPKFQTISNDKNPNDQNKEAQRISRLGRRRSGKEKTFHSLFEGQRPSVWPKGPESFGSLNI